MMVALTMAVPLQYILFAVKTPYFVPDPNKLSWLNIVGLVRVETQASLTHTLSTVQHTAARLSLTHVRATHCCR